MVSQLIGNDKDKNAVVSRAWGFHLKPIVVIEFFFL